MYTAMDQAEKMDKIKQALTRDLSSKSGVLGLGSDSQTPSAKKGD